MWIPNVSHERRAPFLYRPTSSIPSHSAAHGVACESAVASILSHDDRLALVALRPHAFPPPRLPPSDHVHQSKISRSKLYLIDLVGTKNNTNALKDARKVVEQSALEPEPFGYSEIFVFTEQFLVIYQELILNFALALAAVGILSIFVLGKLAIVALVCLTVVRLSSVVSKVAVFCCVFKYSLSTVGVLRIFILRKPCLRRPRLSYRGNALLWSASKSWYVLHTVVYTGVY